MGNAVNVVLTQMALREYTPVIVMEANEKASKLPLLLATLDRWIPP